MNLYVIFSTQKNNKTNKNIPDPSISYKDLSIELPLELHLFDGKTYILIKYAVLSIDL